VLGKKQTGAIRMFKKIGNFKCCVFEKFSQVFFEVFYLNSFEI
jgi:hypothetical protein